MNSSEFEEKRDSEEGKSIPSPGLVSRLMQYVVQSSPIKLGTPQTSGSHIISSPMILDNEITSRNRRLKNYLCQSKSNDKFYTPATSSTEAFISQEINLCENTMSQEINSTTVSLENTSAEDLYKLNQVLELTDICEQLPFESKTSVLRSNSIEGAVKIELLQEEVASLHSKLARANAESQEFKALIEEYEQTMTLIIGKTTIFIDRCQEAA
jgi:hypothetical protein